MFFSQFEELVCLGELPHLNSLELTGNPICDNAYYRRNVLNVLGPRFPLVGVFSAKKLILISLDCSGRKKGDCKRV